LWTLAPAQTKFASPDQAIKENKLNRQVAMSEVADTTLLREAQKRIGDQRKIK
jgi:hypothetical protein